MKNKARIMIILLVILVVASLSLAGGIFYLLQKEKMHRLSLQEELDELKTRHKITESELDRYKNIVKALETKLQEADNKIAKLNSDLQTEKKAKDIASEQLELLRKKLEEQVSLKEKLEEQLDEAKKEAQNLKTKLAQLESQKSELETRIKDLEAKAQNVELGTIVVSSEVSPPAPVAVREQASPLLPSPLEEGRILVVNKEYNFAVINLGSQDGVKIGDVFSVYHGNKYIGDIKVEKVHESMSAAGFVSLELKQQITEGDRVQRKGA